MKLYRRALLCLVLASFSLSWVRCSSAPTGEGDPSAQLADAEGDIKGKRYQIAIDKLRAIKSKFPYSKVAPDAQLRIGDVYFLQELYVEAALSYEAFRDLYPKHEKASYALYRIGESYRSDMPANPWRDLSSANRALEAYSDFVENYPKDPLFANAKEYVEVVRERLAQKEYLIGRFYYRDGHYDSAKGRFEKILKTYPEASIAVQARERLQETEKKLKE